LVDNLLEKLRTLNEVRELAALLDIEDVGVSSAHVNDSGEIVLWCTEDGTHDLMAKIASQIGSIFHKEYDKNLGWVRYSSIEPVRITIYNIVPRGCTVKPVVKTMEYTTYEFECPDKAEIILDEVA
jgi:hypothetical protein